MRSQRLDVLRLVAVLLVLGNHLPAPSRTMGPIADALFGAWRRGGWVGVDLFFVLSGFLVASLLLEEHARSGRIAPLVFLARRGFKIYPAFWVLTGVTVLASLTFYRQPALLGKTLCELLFVQNYGPGLWNHTWSLAVEEHFYLALVLLLWGLGQRPGGLSRIPRLVSIVAAVALCLRVLTALRQPYTHQTFLFPTHLRIDSLFIGVGVAWLLRHEGARVAALIRGRAALLFIAGLAMFLPAFVLDRESTPMLYTAGYTILAIGAALVVLALLGGGPVPSRPALTLPSWLGARSYSIYLWHMPVAIWMMPRLAYALERRAIPVPYPLYAAVYMICSLTLGAAMAQLVELPLLRVRDRLLPKRRAAPAWSA